ncbi:MAG: DUF2339 domain-containing protein [Desulfobacteraceae bacterium]|nr:MAG: DUF2339 domain-containing protein [Desulfobacteraceae bacterium]
MAMVYLISGGIGWLIGVIAHRIPDAFYGLVLGILVAEIYLLRKRLTRLEGSAKGIVPKAEKIVAESPVERDAPVHPVPEPPIPHGPFRETRVEADYERESALDLPDAPEPPPVFADETLAAPAKIPETKTDTFSSLPGRLVEYLKNFFTTGNVVTKIGVIVLFFGFSFLLKYAAQRNLIPIEFRLIGVFLAGLGMLGAGWRLRMREMMYGLILQGGGVGVLYLTVFAAARFYHLLPYGFAFAVMFCLVALSGILAVLQDARALAVSGIIGGFLAPVLMSTGSGSHVALFSYYALLNLGIVGIAWHKSWRELNLIGFGFTFVIASLWGGKYYRPGYFSTTEPFLILFFLYYVIISVLYALRQPLNLKGYVDGTLVFGVPLAAFGLQYGLVRNFEYGLAISALCLGLFYILLATILWRRISGLRAVVESFLAFGVVFGSLAIPLALDGRWTSAAWAIEGAAILWIGARQNRILPRIFGILLQAGSGVSFLLASHLPFRQIPVANSFFVGCLLISLAGLFSSWYLTKKSEILHQWERYAAIPLMVWGIAWWFGGAFQEIDRFVGWQDQVSAALIHAAGSFLLMDIIGRRLVWKQFAYPSLFLLPVMGLASLHHLGSSGDLHLFARMGFLAWGISFCAQYRLLFTCETIWPERMVRLWHQFTLWLLIFVLARESAYYVDVLLQVGWTWQFCVRGVVPGVMVMALLSQGDRLSWPVRRFHDAYFGMGAGIPVLYLFAWAVFTTLYHGDPAPLQFVPVINPMELTQIYLLFIVLQWIGRQKEWLRRFDFQPDRPVLSIMVYAAGFLLLNAMVARTIHFWADVPYTIPGLYGSVLFQAAISILWGMTALITTLGATRKGSRVVWIIGALILSLVVIKLFIVDLAGTGTVARIISFLGVGSLMLLIGYFSPLPPARHQEVS